MIKLSKVLVVDDSPMMQQTYKSFFRRYEGCEVFIAKNGLEGLKELALESKMDLVILDIFMPVMDGLKFIEAVRQSFNYKDVPVIVVSTDTKQEDIDLMLSRGARSYIPKPFKPEDLEKAIENTLG